MEMKRILIAVLLALSSCAPAPAPTATPQVTHIFASLSTRQWLAGAYNCAEKNQLILIKVNDPALAEIRIGLGEPENWQGSLYQIGQDDIVIAASSDSPLESLSREQAGGLFRTSDINDPQIWAFSGGEDIQKIFNREILPGEKITSLARMAVSVEKMSDGLAQDPHAIGILPAHALTPALKELYAIRNVPILAMTPTQPAGSVKILLACLQQANNKE